MVSEDRVSQVATSTQMIPCVGTWNLGLLAGSHAPTQKSIEEITKITLRID